MDALLRSDYALDTRSDSYMLATDAAATNVTTPVAPASKVAGACEMEVGLVGTANNSLWVVKGRGVAFCQSGISSACMLLPFAAGYTA